VTKSTGVRIRQLTLNYRGRVRSIVASWTKLAENIKAQKLALKIYMKVVEVFGRRVKKKVFVRLSTPMSSEEVAYIVIPFAYLYSPIITSRYNIAPLVITALVRQSGYKILSASITYKQYSRAKQYLTITPILLLRPLNQDISSINTSSVVKTVMSELMNRNIISPSEISELHYMEEPILTAIISKREIENEVKIIIHDGFETYTVTVPLRIPEWSLSDISQRISNDIDSFIVKPILKKTKYAPRGLLIIGPPGVGKSVLAEAISHELNAKILELNPNTYRSMWYGATEKILSGIFTKVRGRNDVVLLIDDADFLTSRATSIHEVHMSEISLLLKLLQDPKKPFTIMTSNMPDIIDPALVRPGRIDYIIILGYPDRETRRKVVEVLMDKYEIRIPDEVIDDIVMKTKWFSHAEIDGLIRLAASIGEGRIALEHIEKVKRKFSINVSERRRIQDFLKWHASRIQGVVLSYVPEEHEI